MLECTVYICDFHRLQAWQRWLNTSSHGLVQGKEEVLALLKKLAKAPRETAYETALQSLKESQYWKTNSDLRNWFEKKWLCENKVNEREIYELFHYVTSVLTKAKFLHHYFMIFI